MFDWNIISILKNYSSMGNQRVVTFQVLYVNLSVQETTAGQNIHTRLAHAKFHSAKVSN